MPRPSIGDMRSLGDYARLFRWRMAITQVPTALLSISSDLTKTLSSGAGALDARCESIEIPKRTVQDIQHRIRGNKINLPGISEPLGIFSFLVVETIDNYSAKLLQAWREAIWSSSGAAFGPTGVSSPDASLVGEITMWQLDNGDNDVWKWVVQNCWLYDYDPGGQFEGQMADLRRNTYFLAYDDFYDAAP